MFPQIPQPADPPEAEQVNVEVEQTKVEKWRCYCLLLAGYDLEDALLLARNPQVDLHSAVGLLENGCTPTTALLILL